MTQLISLAASVIALLPAAALAVDIGTLHCNDATGVPLQLNSVVTVRHPDRDVPDLWIFIQDATGGINVFGLPQVCSLAMGDDVEVTGTLIHFNGLTEVASTATVPLTINVMSTGNPGPAPIVLTPTQVEQTYQLDNCEPNESILATVSSVFVPRQRARCQQATVALYELPADQRRARLDDQLLHVDRADDQPVRAGQPARRTADRCFVRTQRHGHHPTVR
jgi:hypothetical protein